MKKLLGIVVLGLISLTLISCDNRATTDRKENCLRYLEKKSDEYKNCIKSDDHLFVYSLETKIQRVKDAIKKHNDFASSVNSIKLDTNKYDYESVNFPKFLTINVINAKSISSAKKIAFSVACSPLVKTAIAGEDPNWGRIIMGIGKSGEKVDKNKISIKFGEFLLAENGSPVENIDLDKLREYMKWDSIIIEINLNSGSDFFECYTCDFTHDYIDINADYKNVT